MAGIDGTTGNVANGKGRLKLLFIYLASVIIGAVTLYLYSIVNLLDWKPLFYIIPAVLISYGIAGFTYLIESYIRNNDSIISRFSESAFWLSLFAFAYYQFSILSEHLFKILFGLILIGLSIVFSIYFQKAISGTAFGKKRWYPGISIAAVCLLVVTMAFLTESFDTLIFCIPLIIILLYSTYILQGFLLIEPLAKIDPGGPIDMRNVATGFRIIFNDPNRHLRESFLWTMLLIFIIQTLITFFVKINALLTDQLMYLPQVSIAAYLALLAIVVAFSAIYPRKPNHESARYFMKPILGLVQMCIVFATIALISMIVGVNADLSILKDVVKPSTLLESIATDGALLRVILLQLLLLSFPPTFMYIYGLLKIMREVRDTEEKK